MFVCIKFQTNYPISLKKTAFYGKDMIIHKIAKFLLFCKSVLLAGTDFASFCNNYYTKIGENIIWIKIENSEKRVIRKMEKARTVMFISNAEKKCQLSKNITDNASLFALLNSFVVMWGSAYDSYISRLGIQE